MFGHFPFASLPFSDFIEPGSDSSPPGGPGPGPGFPSGHFMIMLYQSGLIRG